MFRNYPGSGFTIWITGMQGSGKRTLAREVATRLQRLEKPVEVLEGPDWYAFTGEPPGDNQERRLEVIRRTGFLARAITRAGGYAVVPQISPYKEARDALRRDIGRFLEVFVDCPIETLKERDPSGRYAKAERGEIPNFIGVTEPYEPPRAPEVWYDSSRQSVDEAATAVLEALVREGALQPDDVGLSRMPRKPSAKKKEPPRVIQAAPEAPARAPTKKAAGKKPARVEKQAPEKKAAEKKPSRVEKKPSAKKVPEKKAPARKPAAKAPPKKAAARKETAKKAPVRAARARPAPARKPARPAAKRAPARPAGKARAAAPAKGKKAVSKPAARTARPGARAAKAAPTKVAAKTARATPKRRR